jgi:hypothetical protein
MQLPAQKTGGLYKPSYQKLRRVFVAAVASRLFGGATVTIMAALNTNPLLPCTT